MMDFFYSPGACSLASYIALEEAGAEYSAHKVDFKANEQRSDAYLKINPRGKVPALRLADGSVLTENVAILTYIGKSFPDAKLLPAGLEGEAQAISTMTHYSALVHPAFRQVSRPNRFVDDESVYPKIQEAGRKNFFSHCGEIDANLQGRQWIMGSQFTVCDGYALVFYRWGRKIGLPMKELANFTAHSERVMARPKARRVVEETEEN